MNAEKPKPVKLERLEHDLSQNAIFTYAGEKVRVYPNAKGDSTLSETNPGQLAVTPNSGGGGRGIMIWIHESVPLPFRAVVLHHELTEMDLFLHKGMDMSEAHKKALASHRQYAKKFLSKADHAAFVAWEATLDFKH